MGRLWGGGALIAIALFVVLGFVRSEVDPLALSTIVALAIGAGLPAGGAAWLLARHFGARRRIGQRREQLRRDTIEAEVLRMAGRNDGRLTAVEVAGELAVSPAMAEEVLNGLMTRELAEIEVTDSGLLVYTFHDVRHLSEKAAARGILEPSTGP